MKKAIVASLVVGFLSVGIADQVKAKPETIHVSPVGGGELIEIEVNDTANLDWKIEQNQSTTTTIWEATPNQAGIHFTG